MKDDSLFFEKGLNRAKHVNSHLLLGVKTPISLGKCDPESSPDGHPHQVVSLDLHIVDDLTSILPSNSNSSTFILY